MCSIVSKIMSLDKKIMVPLNKKYFISLTNSIKVQICLLLYWQGFVHEWFLCPVQPFLRCTLCIYFVLIHFYCRSNYCVFMLLLTRQTITVVHQRTHLNLLSLLYCSSILYFYDSTIDVDCFCLRCLAVSSCCAPQR